MHANKCTAAVSRDPLVIAGAPCAATVARMPEATMRSTPAGRIVDSDGWFVLNLGEAVGMRHARAGVRARLERPEARFPEFGITVHMLEPGQPASLYHREDAQEDFLVLAGECLLVVEEEERRLAAWDFVHCPAGTLHLFVGAGDGPCAILMVGARGGDRAPATYPASEAAGRYGGSVPADAASPAEAYAAAGWAPEFEPVPMLWPATGRDRRR